MAKTYTKHLVAFLIVSLSSLVALRPSSALDIVEYSLAPTEVKNDPALMKQLRCLAKNIYFESRGEPFNGKVAVGQVTINRVANPRFPDSICDVVHQRWTNPKTNKVICQFSWTCKPQARIKLDVYSSIYVVAIDVLLNRRQLPALAQSTHFHSKAVTPNWNLPRVAVIGNHIFYGPHNPNKSPGRRPTKAPS